MYVRLLFKISIGNAETEAWFIDSLEEWRKAKNLSNFILLNCIQKHKVTLTHTLR